MSITIDHSVEPYGEHDGTATPFVRRVVDQVGESIGDLAAAVTMPPEAYTSEEFYQFELDAVFRRSWLYLCHVSEIPNRGDYLAVTVADEPLLVTHDHEDQIHVVSAVCQHRGYVIAEDDGDGRLLRCPYHFWSYGLDGRLLGAPSMAPAHDLDHLKATIALPKLRVEVWHGMVFANFDDDAAELIPTLGPAEALVEHYGIDDLVVIDSRDYTDLPFNWKNMQENALEEYHTTYVHKGWHENAPAHLVQHVEYSRGDGSVQRYAGLLQRAGEPVPGFPVLPVIPDMPEEAYHRLLFVAVPPLHFAAIEATGIKMFRITPQSAGRTTLTISWMFPRETVETVGVEELMKGQLELIEVIDKPDLRSNAGMFKGLKSKFAPRGPYSPYEATLPEFNEWLHERYATHLAELD
jgi:phenylpropionate dioxygenase-like ring-hydroxylating dioxygenase large terminal subunit